MNIAALLTWGKQQLAISSTAILDAEVLLAYSLKLNRAQLYSQLTQEIDHGSQTYFEQLIARHKAGEPIAYIIGEQEFWSLKFKVTPDTLIPRPETELLVETVLNKLPADLACKVADLGTGSGAIAIAIAHERPHWEVVATDNMPNTLMIAKSNAQTLKIPNIQFQLGDWCAALGNIMFDAIVSNPPYIDIEDAYWHTNINQFEPKQALFAPAKGLAAINNIIMQARCYLKPGGWLCLEHGYDQSEQVANLLVQNGYKNLEKLRDLASIQRVAVAQK